MPLDVSVNQKNLLILAGLFLATVLLFSQTFRFDFINFDDPDYVTENEHVLTGLTFDNIRWAFTTGHAANWHPLTWMSHQLDVTLFGAGNPGMHHLVNVLLHAINASLLFWFLIKTTGKPWTALMAAVLFAWHPLRVESVAWVSERKDVLSACFWLLTMLAYARYVRVQSWQSYVLCLVLLALGLMSKPMLVTLPCALLLMDVWPLRRVQPNLAELRKQGLKLALEKLPMLALAMASSLITYSVQRAGGAVQLAERFPLDARLENALLSTVQYLLGFIYPVHLSFFYPHPVAFGHGGIENWKWAGAGIVIAAITAAAWINRHRRPWLMVGWLWFLGTLVPVCGIVQVGMQARADRYTYIPMIGIAIIVAWIVRDVSLRSKHLRMLLTSLFIVLAGAMLAATIRQTAWWRDDVTLMRRGVALDDHNIVAFNNLGLALHREGDHEGALRLLRRAIELDPAYSAAQMNLANVLLATGDDKGAVQALRAAIKADPRMADPYVNYANILLKQQRREDAMLVYQQGLKHARPNAALYTNYALTLAEDGDVRAALEYWRKALQLKPDDFAANLHYGVGLSLAGRVREGVDHLHRAMQRSPDDPRPKIKLAWIYATHPRMYDPSQALDLATRAMRETAKPTATDFDTLAVAQAANGRFDEAVESENEAFRLAQEAGNQPLADQIQQRLLLFQAAKPFGGLLGP